MAPGSAAASAAAKMRFLYSAVNWRRWALASTSESGRVLVSPGTALRSVSLRSASLRSAPGDTKTRGGDATPFTFVFMSISFSAPYTKCRAGRRLTDLLATYLGCRQSGDRRPQACGRAGTTGPGHGGSHGLGDERGRSSAED